jgi:hypothetical protein
MKNIFSTINFRIFIYLSLYKNFTLSHIHNSLYFICRTLRDHNFNRFQKRNDDSSLLFEKNIMYALSNVYRNVASTLIFKNLQKNEIMQNDLNQLTNFKRIKINSFLDKLKKNLNASKMFMLNLNERFK